jgi:hypothetical protein
MTRPPRNPRRAYDPDGNELRPMSLRNMREHGVRSVLAICQEASCGRSGSINVDHLPDSFQVPDVLLRLLFGVRLMEGEDATGLESGRLGSRSRATARVK